MIRILHPSPASRALRRIAMAGLLALGSLWAVGPAHVWAADPAHGETKAAEAKPAAKKQPEGQILGDNDVGVDLKAAIREQISGKKTMTLVVSETPSGKQAARLEPAAPPKPVAAPAPVPQPVRPAVVPRAPRPTVVAPSQRSREELQARAAALAAHTADSTPYAASGHGVPWSYSGETGPQNWGKLSPEYSTCATGKRQSPIHIEDSATLKGPAEPLLFNYRPSVGSVVNNGHTIQVDVQGDNTLVVRGTTYRLVQFHFHTPSEEQINYKSYAMVAHLVHKSSDDQFAVVAVLLDPGEPNAAIDKVWTYMPLDVGDRVHMPPGLLDVSELLPKDQRYYQFIGSLTTPPCTEGVLWMVLKQPVSISPAQWRLFSQLYPNNARPVQPVNGRPVRNMQ